MNYLIDPLRYYNGFISASRNIYLTSSVAFALFTYSNTFKVKSSINLVKLGSICIIFFSLCYGIITNYGMIKYINYLEEKNDIIQEDIQINLWKKYVYLNILYVLVLFFILVVALRRFINNHRL